jgi:LPXTG-motif cell wall-anchored protein
MQVIDGSAIWYEEWIQGVWGTKARSLLLFFSRLTHFLGSLMNKTASVLAIAGTLAFLGAGAAQAAPVSVPAYADNETEATVSDGTIAPGESVVFASNEGIFTPGEIIDITVDRTDGTPAAAGFGAGGAAAARGGLIVLNAIVYTGTATADAAGNFSYTVQLEEEGVYTLAATGRTSGETVASQVVVDSANATGGTTDGTTGGTTDGATGGTTDGATGGTTDGTNAVKGGLANTGIDSAMLLWGAAGIGALGLGAGSIVVSRRRSAVA